jgi:hypothetical protein
MEVIFVGNGEIFKGVLERPQVFSKEFCISYNLPQQNDYSTMEHTARVTTASKSEEAKKFT